MDLTELYRNKTGNTNRHPWEITRASIIRFLLKKSKSSFNHIADIGSGDIFILNELQKHSLAKNYSAIDIGYTDTIISYLKSVVASEKINFYKNQSDFESVNQLTDCILLLDVLEHCEDDTGIITSITSSPLTDIETYFIISVPSFQSLFSKHDLLLNHYRRYNQKSLVRLCNAGGLRVIQSGYFFFSLLPVRIFQLIFEKLGHKKPKKTIDNWTGSPFQTKIISSILWIDFRICNTLTNWGIKIPGLSCFCLCQKLP